ncbi:hypothetical protein ACS0TY_018481 [Phlomoides rotata]
MMNQLKKMPCEPDDHVWNALVGVCRILGNVELGRMVGRHLVELEPQSLAAYLLLSGIYAALGRWESAQEVRELMRSRNLEKDRALSWLEIVRKFHRGSKPGSLHDPKRNSISVMDLLADKSLLRDIDM